MIDFLKELHRANADRQREWDPEGKLTTLFHSNELGGEAGEAQNKIKKLERLRLGLPGGVADLDAILEELSDVLIVADLIILKLEKEFDVKIDYGAAVAQKFNRTSIEKGLKTMFSNVNEPVVHQPSTPETADQSLGRSEHSSVESEHPPRGPGDHAP